MLEPPPSNERKLQTFEQYVDLYQDLINGLLGSGPLAGKVDTKMAQAIGLLSGYAGTALKNAHGNKTQLTVFLKDVHMNRVNISRLSDEQMIEFLQGDEGTQVEMLKQIKDVDGSNTIEAKVLPKKEPKQRIDKYIVSSMAGVSSDNIEDVLKGEAPNTVNHPTHDWQKTVSGLGRFCSKCLLEKEKLEPLDMETPCSEQENLY